MDKQAEEFLAALVRESQSSRGNTVDAYVVADKLGLSGESRADILSTLLAEGSIEKINNRFVKPRAKLEN